MRRGSSDRQGSARFAVDFVVAMYQHPGPSTPDRLVTELSDGGFTVAYREFLDKGFVVPEAG